MIFLPYHVIQTSIENKSTRLLQLELLQVSWNVKWFTSQEWLSPEFCQVNHSPGSLVLHCKLILFRNSWSLSLIYVRLLVVCASFFSHFTDPSLAKLSVCKNVFDKISYGKHHDLTKSWPTLKGLKASG